MSWVMCPRCHSIQGSCNCGQYYDNSLNVQTDKAKMIDDYKKLIKENQSDPKHEVRNRIAYLERQLIIVRTFLRYLETNDSKILEEL